MTTIKLLETNPEKPPILLGKLKNALGQIQSHNVHNRTI